MRILIAPDKFKGTMTADEVCTAMLEGARRVFPAASYDLRPLADGGEGTVTALLMALGGVVDDVDTTDPLGRPIKAPIASFHDGRSCIEAASASGLQLLSNDDRDPLGTDSFGTGTLLKHALERRASVVIVGVGGSATVDGGTGIARALGWQFRDAAGKDLAPGGGALHDLHAIEPPTSQRVSGEARIVAACDVDAPLLGPSGAARLFAPQKGASPDVVDELERGLERFAEVVERELGVDVALVPHAGAGGGMGLGLAAFLAAETEPGFDLIARESGLDAALSEADLVLTGEGSIDSQSLQGKAPIALARKARERKVRCLAVAGRLKLDRQHLRKEGIELAVSLEEQPSAMKSSLEGTADATERVLRLSFERTRAPRRSGML